MKPVEKLDGVLKYLYNEYLNGKVDFDHSNNICEKSKLLISPGEAYLILSKLHMDNYLIISSANNHMFKINYNGILFHLNGGYTQELADINRKRFKDEVFNWIIAIGTFLAGLYAIWQLLLELKNT